VLVALGYRHLNPLHAQRLPRVRKNRPQHSRGTPARIDRRHRRLNHVTVVVAVNHARDNLIVPRHPNGCAKAEVRYVWKLLTDPFGHQFVSADDELDQEVNSLVCNE